MIIDIRKLKAERRYEGELHFTLPPDNDAVTLPLTEAASEIRVDGIYRLMEDDALEITGKVRYLLRGACSRCLKTVEKRMEGEWTPCFVKDEPQDEEYFYERDVISLDQSVKDAVMLSMPYVLLCDENCAGIEYAATDERTE